MAVIFSFEVATKEFSCFFVSHHLDISASRLLGWFLFYRALRAASMIPPFKIVLNLPDIPSGERQSLPEGGFS
jgi:hypothetical protein